MMQFRRARQGFCLLLLALVALTTSGADLPNRSQMATMVARAWADTSIGQVADTLGRTATLNTPVLRSVAALIIKDRIQGRIGWTFSTPQRVAGSVYQYDVTATALAPFNIDILMLHLRFTLSGDFRLRIDTSKQAVTESHFDPLSFRFKQLEQ